MSNQYHSTVKGLSIIKLIRNEDNTVLHLPPPSEVTLDLQIEEQVQMTRSQIGENVSANSYASGRTPVLSLVFNHSQPEIWELVIGSRFAVKNDTVVIAKEYVATATVDAVGIGKLGYGILVDQITTFASYKGANGMSIPLTRVAFAGTPANGQFAQGADLALKFGPDIVGKDVSVVCTIPINNCLSLSDVSLGTYRLTALGITTENEVVVLSCNRATPSLQGNQVSMGSATVPVKFFLHANPGECFPYTFKWIGQTVNC